MFNSTPVSLYPVPADAQRSVQHVTLENVPVNVLPKLWSRFSQVKQLECHNIHPPQEVQCVHKRDDCEEPPEETLAPIYNAVHLLSSGSNTCCSLFTGFTSSVHFAPPTAAH